MALLKAGPHPLQTDPSNKTLLPTTPEMKLEDGNTVEGEGKGKAETLPRKDEEDGKTTETLRERGCEG